jgi:hypothetical protein
MSKRNKIKQKGNIMSKRNKNLNITADIVFQYSDQCIDKQQIIDVMQYFTPNGTSARINDFVDFYLEHTAANDDDYIVAA